MDRAARVERMLRAMERNDRRVVEKVRGNAVGKIRAAIEAQQREMQTVFLVALAAVADADLGDLEEELGLPRGDGAPSRRRRRARKPGEPPPTCPSCLRDLHPGLCDL